MAKVLAHGDSATPEDSASDIDSGPRLLPASGETASSIPARDEETTGRAVPKLLAAELGVGLSRVNATGVPMTVGNWKLPGRGKSASSNGSSSSTAPCCSAASWDPTISGCAGCDGAAWCCCSADCCLLACRFTYLVLMICLTNCKAHSILPALMLPLASTRYCCRSLTDQRRLSGRLFFFFFSFGRERYSLHKCNDGFQDAFWALPVQSASLWAHQCTSHLPGCHEPGV